MESAIMDTGDCQPLYHAIRDYYEGMNMKLDQQIPMLLVERQALNEAIVGEKNVVIELLFEFQDFGFWKHCSDSNCLFSRATITCLRQGACVFLRSRQSQVYDIIKTDKIIFLKIQTFILSFQFDYVQILRRPRIGGNRLVGMRTQPQKLTRKCEVTAILVLYGLPR